MRAIALVGLLTLAALLTSGCGSSTPPTPTNPEGVTTKADVAAMKKRLAEGEKMRPVLRRESVQCKAEYEEYEWVKECIEPFEEGLARLTVGDEKLANELIKTAGEGCREALRAGPVYDRITQETVEACEEDIGK